MREPCQGSTVLQLCLGTGTPPGVTPCCLVVPAYTTMHLWCFLPKHYGCLLTL